LQTAPTSSYNDTDNNKKTNQIIKEKFLASIKSDVTRKGALDYIHAYMRYHHLYEGEEIQENDKDKKKKYKNKDNSNLVYRYDWLIGDGNNDVQTIENMIIDFVVYKRDKEGLGAAAIDNYINHLVNFYWVARVRGIDWRLVKRHKPDNVKKTQDREYYAEEVIAIEEKLDVRGKVVSGVMRGSGVGRGAVQLISVGDLFPIQTKYYGKAYKIIVYRGTSDMYATACIPEVATKIDDYFKYRMRFGEVCKYYGKSKHKHELHDGYEVIEKWYEVDEPHLNPDAPLIREDFDRDDPFAARYPKRISKEQIADIIRDAAVASGVRNVNKGQIHERHKTMCTHGLRKLFNKRCRQKKVDPIIRARLLGQKSGDPKEGISKLMMTYDPEEWAEMQAEFESAIPHLTITEVAIVKTKLEQAQAQLQNVPTIEQLQTKLKEAEESKKRLEKLEAQHEILQANTASVLNALTAAEMGVKQPTIKIITWRSDKGEEEPDGLFEAAAIARAENEAREKEHQQRHHKQK
jgi:hypothetical protein